MVGSNRPSVLFILRNNSSLDRWIYLEAPEDIVISIMRKDQVYHSIGIRNYTKVIVEDNCINFNEVIGLNYRPSSLVSMKLVLDASHPRLFVDEVPLGAYLESLTI